MVVTTTLIVVVLAPLPVAVSVQVPAPTGVTANTPGCAVAAVVAIPAHWERLYPPLLFAWVSVTFCAAAAPVATNASELGDELTAVLPGPVDDVGDGEGAGDEDELGDGEAVGEAAGADAVGEACGAEPIGAGLSPGATGDDPPPPPPHATSVRKAATAPPEMSEYAATRAGRGEGRLRFWCDIRGYDVACGVTRAWDFRFCDAGLSRRPASHRGRDESAEARRERFR